MKVVLITGVSSGFGRSIAQRLALKEFKVYGSVRREVDPIPGVSYINMDVTSRESVEKAVGEIYGKEGRIDVLISNAGMGIAGPLEFTSIDDAQHQMDVNFFGMVRVVQAVLPIMRNQKGGRIICVSSIAGIIGLPFQGVYSASKFAIEGYCLALRTEVKPHNVEVVLVNPGDFSTNFTRNRSVVDTPEAKEAYPDYIKTMEVIEQEENRGLEPEVLAKKIERILLRKKCPPRFVVASPVQRASVFIKRILPEGLFYRIIQKYYMP
jgi:hypothetical protein